MTLTGRPPGRYDDPRTLPRWALVALASALAAALLTGTFFAWQSYWNSRVPFTVLSYRVIDAGMTEVRFAVSLDKGERATCLVRARDAGGTVVGRVERAVGPGTGTSRVEVTEVLSTTGRAATGEVTACQP